MTSWSILAHSWPAAVALVSLAAWAIRALTCGLLYSEKLLPIGGEEFGPGEIGPKNESAASPYQSGPQPDIAMSQVPFLAVVGTSRYLTYRSADGTASAFSLMPAFAMSACMVWNISGSDVDSALYSTVSCRPLG